jgi:hypothetical protein
VGADHQQIGAAVDNRLCDQVIGMFAVPVQHDRMGLDPATPAAAVIAGALGGLSESVLVPFERIQTTLGVSSQRGPRVSPPGGSALLRPCPASLVVFEGWHNTWDAAKGLVRIGGVRELFRGWSAVAGRNMGSSVLFFTLRDETRQGLPLVLRRTSPALADFVTGGILGACISTAMYPFAVAKSTMQVRAGPHHPMHNTGVIICSLFRERGVLGVYRGATLNFARSALSWSIMNASYGQLRAAMSKNTL